jgi:hypothetical protein
MTLMNDINNINRDLNHRPMIKKAKNYPLHLKMIMKKIQKIEETTSIRFQDELKEIQARLQDLNAWD